MKPVRSDPAPGLEPSGLAGRVTSGKSLRKYRTKQVVYTQGDPADAVFFLQAGQVKLSVVSPRGKEAVIGVLEPDSFFGEGCLAGQSVRMATAIAIEPSSILRVGKAAMMKRLHREPEFAAQFTGYLLSRNAR